MLIIPALGSVGWIIACAALVLVGAPSELIGLTVLALVVIWGTWLVGYVALEIGNGVQRLWTRRVQRMRRYSRMAPLSHAEIETEGEAESPIGIRTLLG